MRYDLSPSTATSDGIKLQGAEWEKAVVVSLHQTDTRIAEELAAAHVPSTAEQFGVNPLPAPDTQPEAPHRPPTLRQEWIGQNTGTIALRFPS